MSLLPGLVEFPRMLFKGDDTRVVADAAQKAAALSEGWEVRLLPGESADEYPAPEPPRRGPGRPRLTPVGE